MLRFLRRKSAVSPKSGWTSVCLWPGRIDVARVERGVEKPKVMALESYERGNNDLDAVKRLGRKYKLSGAPCATLLTAAEYQMLQLEVPSGLAPDTPLKAALAGKLGEMLDQPLAHFTYDVARIPTAEHAPGRAQHAYAMVAGNAAIAPRVRLFHDAKVGLKAIDIPEMAQRNVAALCEQPDRAGSATFDGQF